MQRLPDELIGDVRAVEIAGIDVVHARCHGLTQDGDCARDIAGRTPYELVAIAARKLHRAVAHPADGQRSPVKSENVIRHC